MVVAARFYEKDNRAQNRETVFFVEGTDDATFLEELLGSLGADPMKVGIVTVGGNTKFVQEISAFVSKNPAITQGRIKALGVVCDADSNPAATEVGMNEALEQLTGMHVPSGGWIDGARGIKVGLFVMPSPGEAGDLEKLCLDTVAGHPVEAAAENFVKTAEGLAQENGALMPGSRFKRKAQVFLAGLPGELSRGAGRGFANGLFDSAHPALSPLKSFLTIAVE